MGISFSVSSNVDLFGAGDLLGRSVLRLAEFGEHQADSGVLVRATHGLVHETSIHLVDCDLDRPGVVLI